MTEADIMMIFWAFFGTFFLAAFGIVGGLLYKGIDRKLVARLQSRVGPPITQPITDIQKLAIKQNVVPRNSVAWLFNFAPVFSLTTSIVLLLYLPIAGRPPILGKYGDIIVVLYLLAMPSLGMILGGFASSSPYATVGAQREMVMIMSYEFPLAVAVSAIAWRLAQANAGINVFSVQAIAENPLWEFDGIGMLGKVGFLMIFGAVMAVVPAKLVKIPFDAPEAETEICGGILVEYTGINFGMFYLADAVRTIAVGSLIIALFIPHGISDLVSLGDGYMVSDVNVVHFLFDTLFYLVKLFAIVFVGVTMVRAATARLKIDQITALYWVPVTITALGGLFLIILDKNPLF